MGITISCKKTGRSIDMGMFGFKNLRDKIGDLVGGEFAEHYRAYDNAPFYGEERKKFFVEYDKKINDLIAEKKVPYKVAVFLYACDCAARLRYGVCKEVLKVIGDYDDNILYGYAGRPDCAMFADFKAILKDCVETKSDLVWD